MLFWKTSRNLKQRRYNNALAGTDKMIKIVVATNHRGVIGANGKIPWHSKLDLKRFRDITIGNVVIMGKDTWNSLPKKVRPLPGRINIILTTKEYDSYKKTYEQLSTNSKQDVWVCKDLKEAIDMAKDMYPEKSICLIGGERVYEEGMKYADVIHHTEIDIEVAFHDKHFWPISACRSDSRQWDCEEVTVEKENIDGELRTIRYNIYRCTKDKKTIIPPPPQTPKNIDVVQKNTFGVHEGIATRLGKMVDEKNRQYGGSYQETETVLQLLYPKGIPTDSYADFLCIMRIWDKMKRIGASGGKQDLGGEDARKDLLGIAIRLYEASR